MNLIEILNNPPVVEMTVTAFMAAFGVIIYHGIVKPYQIKRFKAIRDAFNAKYYNDPINGIKYSTQAEKHSHIENKLY